MSSPSNSGTGGGHGGSQGRTGSTPTISIIGAGIGGLTLALGLAKRGFPVQVFEQAPAIGEVGAGLSISPNASKGLRYLGLGEFLENAANEPLMQWTLHGETDEELLVIDRHNCRQEYGAAYYQLHRADLHGELLARCHAIDSDMLQVNMRLTGIRQNDDSVTASFDDGSEIVSDVLIGADGVRSTVRDVLFGASDIRFTGQAAWRGLMPSSKLPAWATERASYNWIGPGRTLVSYPIRGTDLVNFVAFARTEEWIAESWSTPAEPGEIHAAFSDWCDRVQTILAALDTRQSFRWGLFTREPLSTLVNGRVALIGDSAHPMLPFFGQGASSAIEDGVVLSRCLDAESDPIAGLHLYDEVRLERVAHLQSESNQGASRLQGLDPYVLRDQPARNEDSLGIFRYDPVAVPLTRPDIAEPA